MAKVHAGDRVKYNRTTRDDYEGTVTSVTGTHFFVRYDEALNPNGTQTPYPLAILDNTMDNGQPVVEVIECPHAPDIWDVLTIAELNANPHYAAALMDTTLNIIADNITRLQRDATGPHRQADGSYDDSVVRNLMSDILAKVYGVRQKIREYDGK